MAEPIDPHTLVHTLLRATAAGDDAARDELLPQVYDELRTLARHHLRHERPDHTLAPTALVHEAYIKLTHGAEFEWQDRRHFIAIASKAMRHILVDHARRRGRAKRGGDWERVSLTDYNSLAVTYEDRLEALDEALVDLEKYDATLAQLVELRFFTGFTMNEAAEVLNLSVRTTNRYWVRAKAFLSQHLSADPFV
ncbi:MAG: ECF-type sigma factor [Rhodothermales bacterium]